MTYEYHPFANAYRLLKGEEFDALRDDIRKRGLKNPIVLYDGKILDGRNRYRACKELGIEPRFIQSTAATMDDALSDVISDNSRRRNNTPSQKAVIGFRLLPIYEEMAKKRQAHGMTAPGQTLRATWPKALDGIEPRARKRAAEDSGASPRNIQRVKRVHNRAPELVYFIEHGLINVTQAVALADEDKAIRDAVISLLSSGDSANFKQALASVKGPQVIQEDKEPRDAVMSLVTSGEEESIIQDGRDRLPSDQHCQDVADIQAAEKQGGGVPKALLMSESNEWYTPSKYIESARELMGGIDLDPASCEQANETVKAEVYYTLSDDGLSKEWSGRVWMNPPYGKEDGDSNQSRWTKRLIDSYENGEVTSAVFLVNAATDTDWFQRFWMYSICFVTPRVRFIRPDLKKSNPAHGNVFIYLGDDIQGFKDAFRSYGQIVIGEADEQGVSTAKRG